MTWHIFVEVFGAFSIPAILFHLQYDLGSNDLALQIVLQIVSAALPFALVVTCWIAFARGNPRLQRLGSAIVLPLFILNPFTLATGIYFTRAYSAATIALDTYYSDPRLAVAPAGKPKNLIRIILESTERTIWHEEVFSDIAAPLKKLENADFQRWESSRRSLRDGPSLEWWQVIAVCRSSVLGRSTAMSFQQFPISCRMRHA